MARGRGQGEHEHSVGLRNTTHYVIGAKMNSLIAADHAASKLVENFNEGTYIVGGAIRDLYFGRDPKDIDMLIRGIDSESLGFKLMGLPGSVDYTGKSFGVFRYRNRGDEVEIALPRKERSTGEGHKAFEVIADPELSVEEDLWRRDYTVNAMAWDVANQRVVDPYGGRRDIKDKVLRPVREEALSEDPLRILRGAVLVARYDLSVDDDVKAQLVNNKHLISTLSTERVADELRKLAKAPHWQKGLDLMNELEIMPIQLYAAPGKNLSPELRLASFFYMARDSKDDLHADYNLSNDEQNMLHGLWNANDHKPAHAHDCADSDFRRYMNTAGAQNIENYALLSDNEMLLERVRRQKNEVHQIKDLVVGGQDLIEAGMKPGPEFKTVLDRMLEAVMVDPSKNERQYLLSLISHH